MESFSGLTCRLSLIFYISFFCFLNFCRCSCLVLYFNFSIASIKLHCKGLSPSSFLKKKSPWSRSSAASSSKRASVAPQEWTVVSRYAADKSEVKFAIALGPHRREASMAGGNNVCHIVFPPDDSSRAPNPSRFQRVGDAFLAIFVLLTAPLLLLSRVTTGYIFF